MAVAGTLAVYHASSPGSKWSSSESGFCTSGTGVKFGRPDNSVRSAAVNV